MKKATRRASASARVDSPKDSAWRVFLVFLRLGLTSFGGPIAHLGYFRDEFVVRRRWISDASYAELVALCQFLPGPSSSQVGLALGLARAGYGGALAAWAGFTLPSALALVALAQFIAHGGAGVPAGLLHGLKIAAVAVVAQAFWGMARTLCPDRPRIALMALATCLSLLLLTSPAGQAVVIAIGAACGLALLRPVAPAHADALPVAIGPRAGARWLALLALLLAGLPLLARLLPVPGVAVFDAFFRTGALVFGGGHVVLPLLQAEVVPTGWVDDAVFLAGYGAAQAVPGPLFTFAAFLGASMKQAPTGWAGGLLCLLAIFAPSFLLVAGALPFWARLRGNPRLRSALMGANAAVVGLLLGALYHPLWTGAIHQPRDFALAVVAFVALVHGRWPPWLVVLACGAAGWAFGSLA